MNRAAPALIFIAPVKLRIIQLTHQYLQLPRCLHAARTRTPVVRCFPKGASLHPSPPPHPLPFDHAARAATITPSKNRQPLDKERDRKWTRKRKTKTRKLVE